MCKELCILLLLLLLRLRLRLSLYPSLVPFLSLSLNLTPLGSEDKVALCRKDVGMSADYRGFCFTPVSLCSSSLSVRWRRFMPHVARARGFLRTTWPREEQEWGEERKKKKGVMDATRTHNTERGEKMTSRTDRARAQGCNYANGFAARAESFSSLSVQARDPIVY